MWGEEWGWGQAGAGADQGQGKPDPKMQGFVMKRVLGPTKD